jgi:hypothetical protein
LDASAIPDWWKAGNLSASGREMAMGAGPWSALGITRPNGILLAADELIE